MPAGISLTLNEAGYVVGRSRAAINRAVDRGVIRATLQPRGKGRLRTVGAAELRYLAVSGEVERDLTPAARRRVYEALRRLPDDAPVLELGVMALRLTEVDRRIAERLSRLATARSAIADGPDGPVIRGTRVSPHAVAALARSHSLAEIVSDHPALTPAQVEAAIDYAAIYPRAGRPLPTRSFKRMLGDLAEAGTWDVETDAVPVSPHVMP